MTNAIKILQTQKPYTPILFVAHSGGFDAKHANKSYFEDHKKVNELARNHFITLQQQGIKNIYYLHENEINFNTSSTVDGLHPNDYGMVQQANAYEKKIRQILQLEQGEYITQKAVQQFREYPHYDWLTRYKQILIYNQKAHPEVVILGNSIMHWWGGQLTTFPKDTNSWNKYLSPLKAVNMGFGWDRIENMLWRIQHGALDNFKAKKIFIMAGTNNLSIMQSDEEIIQGLHFLLQQILYKQANAKIYMAGILPRRDYEDRIKKLNKKIDSLSKHHHHNYEDYASIFLLNTGKIDEALFSDGLHPNKIGYEALGKKMFQVLK